jgi:isopenicillin-N epimerase
LPGLEEVVARNQALLAEAVALVQQRWGTRRAVGGRPGEVTACSMVAVELPPLAGWPASAEAAAEVHDLLRALHGVEVPVVLWEGRLWVRLSAQLYNRLEHYSLLADAVQQLQ